jgi:CBS domain-containing protein
MKRTAESVMQSSVASVSPETPLADVQRLFVEAEIHGAPVVDEDGTVVGVITSGDLLRAAEQERDTAVVDSDYFRDTLEFSGPDWSGVPADFQDRLSNLSAQDVMTPKAITVSRGAPVAAVAEVLRKNRVHRVFVVDAGILVGVVSTFDLLECLERNEA